MKPLMSLPESLQFFTLRVFTLVCVTIPVLKSPTAAPVLLKWLVFILKLLSGVFLLISHELIWINTEVFKLQPESSIQKLLDRDKWSPVWQEHSGKHGIKVIYSVSHQNNTVSRLVQKQERWEEKWDGCQWLLRPEQGQPKGCQEPNPAWKLPAPEKRLCLDQCLSDKTKGRLPWITSRPQISWKQRKP